MSVRILQGDCREQMRELADASVDSIVTDPPYELGFMGKSWDNSGIAYDPRVWSEALRAAKPGAYLFAFGGTRTFHRLACAIEDAGWEMRDTALNGHMPMPGDCPWLMGWMYGSGFPKSHNGEWGGTALKPAWEPIVCARKPLIGTVEENWREHGTGALNVDACRIAPVGDGDYSFAPGDIGIEGRTRASGFKMSAGKLSDIGRWPANLIHDGSREVVSLFPREAGAAAPVHTRNGDKFRNAYGAFAGNVDEQGSTFHGDSGSAARFFYCAKATQEDRNEGLRAFASVTTDDGRQTPIDNPYLRGETKRANHHPTVKPTALMRWLCRLVTPHGGVILDPFMGSGSTGKAAMLEGFQFVGIDLSPEYIEIARARIDFARRQGHQPSLMEAA